MEHIIKINLLRRHLGPISWADAFKVLAEVRGIADRLGSPGGRPEDNRCTLQQLSQELGVNRTTAYRRLALAEALADHPDLAAKVDAGEVEAKRALRVKREREVAERASAAETVIMPPSIDLRLGDFRDVLNDIPGGSVSLVCTDPPYP